MKKKNAPVPGRVRRRIFPAVLLLALAGALLAVNLLAGALEKRYGWRRDFSFNAVTTQSETTLAVLESLPHPVHVYALFRRGDEDAPLLELLDRYAAASPAFTWEQVDISVSPGLLNKFRSALPENSVTNNSLVVWCEATDRYRVLSYESFVGQSYDPETGNYVYNTLTYERAITSALRYVSLETVPRAMIVQGHGELDQEETALLADLLDSNGYDVGYFTLNAAQANLAPGDLLFLLSPQRDLSPTELDTVTAFLRAGGSVFFSCDYSDPVESMPNYASLLRYYGFLPLEGVVVASTEEPGTCYENNRLFLLPLMDYTEITAPMKENGAATLLMAGCRAFRVPEEADAALQTDPVLLSGEKAHLLPVAENRLSLDPREGDARGPFALALMARRITDTGSVSRAFVLGSSSLLTSQEIYAMTDAQEFIIRTAAFLESAGPDSLAIMAKAALRPQLSARSVFPGTLAVFMLPALVLVAAFLVLGPRRKL
ncbi:MAG: Gldg family protein [Clostridia bacterium]|nr:Gldg family protein [Clostridia bacterium]